jgi:chromosome segregation ATPase
MGLYQRFSKRASTEEAPKLPGAAAAPQIAGVAPQIAGVARTEAAKPPADSGGGRSITFDEQVEIIGEINNILRKNRMAIRPDTFQYTPRRRGATLPILVNAGAVALTLAAALGIAILFNAGERTLVSHSAELLTAEGQLLQALKKESAEQLGRKDVEIARIQDRLQALARDRDRLKLESQSQLSRREAELKTALERELAAERQKLEREGLKADAVERQLADLQARLAEANQKQIADLRRQAEAELAAKDASLAAMNRQYTESLGVFRQERTELEKKAQQREQELTAQLREKTAAAESEVSELSGQLGALNEQRAQERAASDQLLAAYTKVFDSWKASRYDEALRNLGAVRELLSRPSITGLPAIRSRLPVERSLVEALARLFESEKTAAAPQAAGAPAALAEAQSQLTDAERDRRKLQEEAARSRQELARLQSGEKRRAAQEAQLAGLQQRIAGSGTAADSQAQVLALLETKLRVRQALSAEPLASRYPGLYDDLERYLDAYGQEQRQEGQAGALQDAATLLEGLAQQAPRLDVRRLAAGYAGRAREPFSRFVATLREMLK